MKRIARIIISLVMITGIKTAIYRYNHAGDIQVDRGIEAYTDGDYDLAVRELQLALEKNYTNYQPSEVYSILGLSYLELNNLEKSISAQQKAIELNPKFYKAWVNLGIAYRQLGDLDKAEECYQKALKIEPNYAELHASLGALHIFKDEPQQALLALEKAIELDPQLPVAYSNRAFAYAMLDRFEEADKSLQQATILGYQNSAVVKERIEQLKIMASKNQSK